MTRVVIDTNVVVSANLRDEGLPAAILDLAANRRIVMCVSAAVLAEYKDVLNRPRLKLPPHRIAGALAIIRKTSLLVKLTRTVTVIESLTSRTPVTVRNGASVVSQLFVNENFLSEEDPRRTSPRPEASST
jgi:putative PIN family toxin of toxin-antitoxin system